MMANFMCQFAWATGYPGICSNIILGVSVRVFRNEVNTGVSKRIKKIALPNACGSIESIEGLSIAKRTISSANKREFLLPDGL